MISSAMRSVSLGLALAAAGCTSTAGQQPGAGGSVPAAPGPSAPAPAGKPDEPTFALRPYVWGASITGDVSADSDDGTGIAAGFEGLDHLDGALLLAGDARISDDLMLLGDFVWVSLEG